MKSFNVLKKHDAANFRIRLLSYERSIRLSYNNVFNFALLWMGRHGHVVLTSCSLSPESAHALPTAKLNLSTPSDGLLSRNQSKQPYQSPKQHQVGSNAESLNQQVP